VLHKKFFVTYEYAKKAGVLILGRLFQPGLLFEGKARRLFTKDDYL
jgi:hypothetical protein